MTHTEVLKLGCWLHDAQDALLRLGFEYITATSVLGGCPLFFISRYAEGYQPTGAAILYADRYAQEHTR
jgi:hypothetical protein